MKEINANLGILYIYQGKVFGCPKIFCLESTTTNVEKDSSNRKFIEGS